MKGETHFKEMTGLEDLQKYPSFFSCAGLHNKRFKNAVKMQNGVKTNER